MELLGLCSGLPKDLRVQKTTEHLDLGPTVRVFETKQSISLLHWTLFFL